jgi:hypothetical protein
MIEISIRGHFSSYGQNKISTRKWTASLNALSEQMVVSTVQVHYLLLCTYSPFLYKYDVLMPVN